MSSDFKYTPSPPDYPKYKNQQVKRTITTIDKYDKNGVFTGKEVITSEEEIIEKTIVDTTISFASEAANTKDWIIT